MRIRYVYSSPGGFGRRTLSAEELARDVELLAADNNNLLTVQKLLGDSGSETSEEMSLSVDHDLNRPSVAVLSLPIHHPEFYAVPPSVYPPGRAGARKSKSGSGMRTTGSKVDIAAVLGLVCARGCVKSVAVYCQTGGVFGLASICDAKQCASCGGVQPEASKAGFATGTLLDQADLEHLSHDLNNILCHRICLQVLRILSAISLVIRMCYLPASKKCFVSHLGIITATTVTFGECATYISFKDYSYCNTEAILYVLVQMPAIHCTSCLRLH